jgi:hypothetical protein
MGCPMPVRAYLKLGALAMLLSQAHPQMAAAQVVGSDQYAIAGCPSSDIRTPAELRRRIDKSLEHAITYPGTFAHGAEVIQRAHLPRLLIASGQTDKLGVLWDDRAIENSADLNTAFHFALSTKNLPLMRAVAASNVRRTRTEEPFLAPTAELPALADLYVKLFERPPDLLTEYRKLAASALAEAKKIGPAPAEMQEERPEDRRRVAAAWMLFHLERIRMQLAGPGNGHAQSGIFLDAAAALVSRECQPRTWRLIQSLRSGKPVCSDRESDGPLLRAEHPYVCRLVEAMAA